MSYEELWSRSPLDGVGEEYGAVEHRLLLKTAAQIRAAAKPLDKMMVTAAGLGSVIAALREHYGRDVVEEDCPAEKMLAGFAQKDDGPEKSLASKLYQDLIRDLATCENDGQIWYVMAWMLNPSKANSWLKNVLARESEDGGPS